MPRRRTSRRASLPVLAVAAGVTCAAFGGACGEEPAQRDEEVVHEYRKALLVADDRRQQRAEKREQTREQDSTGALIASNERVAGIVLPRGLSLRLGFEREWYYESTLPAEALRAYFGQRLNTLEVVPGGGDTVTYQNALPRDTPDAERVNVRIGPLPKQRGKTEVNIRLAPKAKPPRTEAEARLELEERARYAD